ncbi:MAG: hypothetical protein AAFY53_13270 [Pseudomonadota bacterium]
MSRIEFQRKDQIGCFVVGTKRATIFQKDENLEANFSHVIRDAVDRRSFELSSSI